MRKGSEKRLHRNQYLRILNLVNEQPWLLELEEEVSELIDTCRDWDERVLVFELLHRFKFIEDKQVDEYIQEMAKQIIEVWKLTEEETLILSPANDPNPDSADEFLQRIKEAFARQTWHNANIVMRFGKARKKIHKYDTIVLIDEFAGTGSTMVNRVGQLKKWSALRTNRQDAANPPCIKVCVLASMLQAQKAMEAKGIEVYTALSLEKGISGYLAGKDLCSAYLRMLRLESELMKKFKGRMLPSFGYGRAEALYGRRKRNAPNSVFPIFWWPCFSDGRFRKPLFYRFENDQS